MRGRKLTPEELQGQSPQQAANRRHHAKHRERLLLQMRARYQARQAALTPEELDAQRAKKNAAEKRYYATHTAKISAKKTSPVVRTIEAKNARERRAANPEPRLAYESAYRASHREAETAKSIAWAKRNPEKVNARVARRIAMVRNAPINDVTAEQREAVIAMAHGVCAYCSHFHPDCQACHKGTHKLTVDHITAIANGGPNTLHNLVACCRSCNARKRTRPNPVPVQPLLL